MDENKLIASCVEALKQLPEMAYLRDMMAKSQAETEEKAQMEAKEKEMVDEEEGNGNSEAEPEDEKTEPAKLRMQRDQERRKYAKLETEYKTLFSKVAELEKAGRVSTRKADLLALEGEGFAFDLADELEVVSDMEPARYTKHIAGIRKNYRKAPIGVHVNPAPVAAEGGNVEAKLTPTEVADKALVAAFEANKTRGRR